MILKEKVSRIFATEEIRSDKKLQNLFWALLVGFAISFLSWSQFFDVTPESVMMGRSICPPWFQNCESLYVFSSQPQSYGMEILYAALFLSLVGACVAAAKQNWMWAQALLIPPLLWKLIYLGFLSGIRVNSYEFFHIPLVLIFLLGRRKFYFSRLIWVTLYFLCALVKLDQGWIAATYFTSLKLGMPLVSDSLAPLFTNAVILFEILSPWALLSHSRKVRYVSLGAWILFHVYSYILVGFNYPLYCLPILLALFLPDPVEAEKSRPTLKEAKLGWTLLLALVLLQVSTVVLSGRDRLYTLQWSRAGLSMFIANYQCVVQYELTNSAGPNLQRTFVSRSSMLRCNPYDWYYRVHKICQQNGTQPVHWKLWSSVDGGPFYELVNQENACNLKYNNFSRNDWLQTTSSGARIVGYPQKNVLMPMLWKSSINETVFKEPQISLSAPQTFLKDHVVFISSFYWCLWFLTLVRCGRWVWKES